MLPQKNRIPKKEFPSFKNKGVRFLSPSFTGTIYPSTAGSRVSVVVSKKTAKSAVLRNRLRRVFYAAVEKYIPAFTSSVLIVLYPKKEAALEKTDDITKEIKKALQNTKVLT